MPLEGTVVEVNEALEATPELVNEMPYESGWMIKIKFENPSALEHLLDAKAYQALILS